MRFSGYSIPLIILAFLLGLGSMLGVQYLYQNQQVDRPLQEIYEQDQRVIRSSLQREPDGTLLIELKMSNVEDFFQVYRELNEKTRNILGSDQFRIQVQDERDEFLNQAYYQMHFSLQEGIATGKFTLMAEQIDQFARQYQLDQATVRVENDGLYVHLTKGQHYLYQIIPRPEVRHGEGESTR